MNNYPIGVFDSGIGGLGIFKEIIAELPHESLIYFADSNRCPYGTRDQKDVQEIIQSIVQYLIDHYKIKMAVVACNTATVSGISYLREKFPQIPIVGVVPVIKPASALSQTKEIACFATENTTNSEAHLKLIEEFANGVHVYNIICYDLVHLVEEGLFQSEALKSAILKYIEPLLETQIDVLALGCTHYTLIQEEIRSLLPENIQLMDSNIPVARQVKRVLTEQNLLCDQKNPEYHYIVNGDPKHFEQIVKPILNGLLTNIQSVQFK